MQTLASESNFNLAFDAIDSSLDDVASAMQEAQNQRIAGIQLTVGADEKGDWSYQTGDNSYMGSAYHYPYWGVVGVYRNSNCRELAREIKDQIEEAMVN